MSKTTIYANARFIPVHYTSEVWTTSNPILLDGEYGFVDDAIDANHWIKRGDGENTWNSLNYITVMPDISGKQDKTDNSLNTTDKTIVGAINELNTGKGTYSKPASGIPKSDLASGVQSSLDRADSALQEHQDISGKQDKTDNSLNTSSKTVVGAINELNSGKGTYSKPLSGIPKSDLASGVQSSLDKADTALQQHQDVSGKADTSYVNTELSKKQDKFADVETSTGNTRLISPTSKIGINCFEGIYFYNGIPTIGNAPINESDAVNKYYVDNFHDNTKLNTSKVKAAQSTTSGDVYDVTYINSLVGNIESLLSNLRGNAQ